MLLLNTSYSTFCITLWNLLQVRLSGKQTLKHVGMQDGFWEVLLGSPHVDEKERKQDWEEQKFGLWCNLSKVLAKPTEAEAVLQCCRTLGQGNYTTRGPRVGCKLLQEENLAWVGHFQSAKATPNVRWGVGALCTEYPLQFGDKNPYPLKEDLCSTSWHLL